MTLPKRKTFRNVDPNAKLTAILGARFAAYRKLFRRAERRELFPAPIHLTFENIDACNKRCVMCARGGQHTLHPKIRINTQARMSLETFQRIMDECVPMGTRAISFGFGEPLLERPVVFRMLEYAHQTGIQDSFLVTNGLLLDTDTQRELLESGLTHLSVSIDAATEQTYRKIRGSGFKTVIEHIEQFLAQREKMGKELPFLRLTFVRQDDNEQELDTFMERWESKADYISIQTKIDHFFHDLSDYDLSDPRKFDCTYPWYMLAIRADGRILPCCSFGGELFDLGNLTQDGVLSVWNGAVLQKIREGILDESLNICSYCQRK